jgi:uncharacterized membrane protein
MNRKNSTLSLAVLGLMTAMVFVSNYLSIPVASSRVHLANALCLLSGLLLGGWKGAIAAGLGSALFDITIPAYVSEAWITFINKGAMALACGMVAGKDKSGKPRLYIAAIVGQATYLVLYLSKNYIFMRYVTPVPVNTIFPVLLEKFIASLFNATFAVFAAPTLYLAIAPALEKSGLK